MRGDVLAIHGQVLQCNFYIVFLPGNEKKSWPMANNNTTSKMMFWASGKGESLRHLAYQYGLSRTVCGQIRDCTLEQIMGWIAADKCNEFQESDGNSAEPINDVYIEYVVEWV